MTEAEADGSVSDGDSDGSDSSDTMWTRNLCLETGKLKVEEDYHAGIGGTLWEGSVLMARWLSCQTTFPAGQHRGKRLIELGAGATGIPGIVAANLGYFQEVIISDIEECLERLHENVAANVGPSADVENTVLMQPLPSIPTLQPAPATQRQNALHAGAASSAAPQVGIVSGSTPPSGNTEATVNRPIAGDIAQPSSAEAQGSNGAHPCPPAVKGEPPIAPQSLTAQAAATSAQRTAVRSSSSPASQHPLGEGCKPQASHQGSLQAAYYEGGANCRHEHQAQDTDVASVSPAASNTILESAAPTSSFAAAAAATAAAAADTSSTASIAAAATSCTAQHGAAEWQGRTAVRVAELDWHRGCEHLRHPPFHVVLVADVLYAVELVEPLLQCLTALSRPDSLVAIAIYNRSARVSAHFWEELPKYFTKHRKVPERDFNSPDQPDDVGIFLLFR